MCSKLYLQRRLSSENKTFSELELLTTSNCVVVLAEPGGGKTELLGSLAKQLGTSSVSANMFVHIGSRQENTSIVIDAFDELAKIDQSGIHKLLANIIQAKPTHVVISSRSSEWDIAATNTVKTYLEYEPLVVRLCDFDDSEQREIFEHYAPGEDFRNFYSEVSRFNLEALLPNPQFLKMFVDAYLESERTFSDKQSIFKLAVERLAKEVSQTAVRTNLSFSVSQKVDISSEIFAKLLLSGAEGISISEFAEDRIYPLFSSLIGKGLSISCVLATRLFKPGDSTDQHRPVHKIVAEYCAADYLTKRIADPVDPLTFHQCLPIIAPNSTVRDELRGLLGWMAALGNKAIQYAAIELDPYAILANGDPSQLEPSSKQLLLSKLKEIEAADPYFRRSDFWRRFSIAGFFTEDIVEDIKVLLTSQSDGHLRDLILELLIDSPIVVLLLDELRQILLDPKEDKYNRIFSIKCLLSCSNYDLAPDLAMLLSEANSASLEVAAKGMEYLDLDVLGLAFLEQFFLTCSNLYPNRKHRMERVVGERYFIKSLIYRLDKEAVEWLLDALTRDLTCICGLKSYKCDCRNGISKIVGSILDHYFNLVSTPYEPLRVWGWIENLNFHRGVGANDNKSVQVLYENRELRQGILVHVFGGLTERNQIFETKIHKFDCHSHSGLRLLNEDYKFLVDLAFDTDNPELWVSFIARHYRHHKLEERGLNELRRHMRVQALEKPIFMRVWAISNRFYAVSEQENYRRWEAKNNRGTRRYKKRQHDIHAENIKYIQENRELVEGGRHWSFLVRFADVVLLNLENIVIEFGDEKLVRNALRNCLEFIEPEVPSLKRLADLQCSSRYLYVERILFASCIEIMREYGNLDRVKFALLLALKTNLNIHYDAVDETEYNSLRAEVDRLLFSNIEFTEQFLRQYLEPQLAQLQCSHPRIDLLQYDEIFSPLKAKLSIEWLERFDELESSVLDTLFDLAAEFGDREKLKEIIVQRCFYLLSKWPESTADEKFDQRCKFWFVRAFYFLNLDAAKPYFNWLNTDKHSLILFDEDSNRMSRSSHSYWPNLTSIKIESILNAFFDKWPKVHLPSSWGTESPVGETAYRFLTKIVWSIGCDTPDEAVSVLDRLIEDQRFTDINNELKSIKAEQLRKKALRDFEPPTPKKIVDMLDNSAVVTVAGLRQLLVQELMDYQKDIDGGEFNAAKRFYTKSDNGNDIHLNEVGSVEIIAERLSLVLYPQSITITTEHQTKNQNRIDITAAKIIDGKRRLLVIEAKGQWHKDLYSAASTQLYERYSVHPNAEQQGVYLVIWFGANESVAGRKIHGITSAEELKINIEDRLPSNIKGLIDVFVLDVSLC
ncbi:NACHT domain-containing protein [Aliivibrio logei]|uniref:NACHT domain-containing protein n=1 Tax=Aliivibrio logei TaxID=688 RepID=UPI0035C8D36B